MTDACQLPTQFLETAVVLAGEPAWKSTDVEMVIQWLADRGCAVVGVELWYRADDVPKWIASSDYNHTIGADWYDYVRRCATSALDFIKRFREDDQALFNLTLMSEV